MLKLAEPYSKRTIRFVDLWTVGDWKLKAYAILYDSGEPDRRLLAAARRVAETRLQISGRGTAHYNAGFVGVHQGKTGNFVFVDWWADENELHHHVYVSPSDRPLELEYMTPTGLMACAWDLYLIGHERDAWVSNVLAAADEPDLDAYLGARLNADV